MTIEFTKHEVDILINALEEYNAMAKDILGDGNKHSVEIEDLTRKILGIAE